MIDTGSSSDQQMPAIQQYLELATQHHIAGRLPEAESIYQQVLQVDPNQPVALNMLGLIASQTNKHDVAIEYFTKGLVIQPNLAQGHYNLGNALKKLGKLDEAVASYHKALAIKPDYVMAHNNLGAALQELRKPDEAVANYRKALALKPDYAEGHSNLGNALQDLGKLDEAVASYHKALALKPDYAEGHNNLGVVLQSLSQFEEAAESCSRALALKPDYVEAHINLGRALQDLGKLDEAVASYHKALAIKPESVEAWNNLTFAAKALNFSQTRKNIRDDFYKTGLSNATRATADFAMLEYYLDSFKPHESGESFRKAMTALPPIIDEEITVNGKKHESASRPQLPDKLVALLHFGRSGTGLLHSLIDGHPEISTLPSIYLRGFFNAGVWGKISADGWCGLPERFADEFAVLFDANSPKPTPGALKEDSPFLGRIEGMANVGENRNESLSLDRDKFCSEALRLMKGLDKVDPRSFLLVAHAAFERIMETKTEKKSVFYHIHNPNDFAKLNFLRYAPDARLVMMVREPVQSCESWIRRSFEDNDYITITHRMISMLFAIDQIAFRTQDSVGIRLEDLKAQPETTLHSLCAWLGVKKTPNLYEMTAQGKKWWGDPSSPDYSKAEAMSPFDDATTRRPVGLVFSEKDQFVLRTLFYPFSVRFRYREPDAAGFENDLRELRPLLDDILDFEKVMAERSKIDPAQFKRSGSYLLLRACFMDRLNVLDELGDYPGMLIPLEITTD